MIGYRSVLTRSVPNNCVAAGVPAAVVRRDVVWERPVVMDRRPDEDVPRPGEKTEHYWQRTRKA